MKQPDGETPPMHAQFEQLEQALIAEFLQRRGYDRHALDQLLPADRDALLKEASVYASSRLAEVESRSHLLREMHGGVPGKSKSGLE
jgi:hypothetical protein